MIKPFKLQKRAEVPRYLHFVIPLFSVIMALLFCAILILSMGGNPLSAYARLLQGAFGNSMKIATTLVKAIPLMLCGLSVAVAFKMKLMNIGAEGQMALGCLAASGVALFCSGIPSPMKIPVMLLAGFAAGGLWALISILPRVYLGVNEVIVTLLMNYVAILFSEYFIYGPWRDPNGDNMPFSAPFATDARLTKFFGDVHTGIFVALIAAIVLYFIFKRTVWGYQIKVIGESPKAAGYAGMNIRRSILITMLISGGLAGLAGVCEVAGTVGILKTGISNDSGYTAIIIAYLSKFNPLVVLVVSVLFGGLQAGGYGMQLVGLPVQIVTMLQGSILLFVLGGEFLTRYRVVRAKQGKEEVSHVG